MGSADTEEHVLDAFICHHPRPRPRDVERWCLTHPQYADAIRKLAAEMIEMAASSGALESQGPSADEIAEHQAYVRQYLAAQETAAAMGAHLRKLRAIFARLPIGSGRTRNASDAQLPSGATTSPRRARRRPAVIGTKPRSKPKSWGK